MYFNCILSYFVHFNFSMIRMFNFFCRSIFNGPRRIQNDIIIEYRYRSRPPNVNFFFSYILLAFSLAVVVLCVHEK